MVQNVVNYGTDMSGSELLDNYITKSQQNVLTSNSGIQRPSYAVAGTKWLDVSVTPWLLKIYDGTDDIIIGSIDPNTNRFIPSDPLTTTGDLIVEGSDGKPTRLAPGAKGTVLTSNGSGQIPSYQLGTYANTDLNNLTSNGQSYIQNITTQIVNKLWKIGDIKASVLNVNHDNWFLCNGQTINRTAYSELYAVIGTKFGAGDGTTTFNLPDYRGKFLRGLGGNSARDIYTTQAEGLPNITGGLKVNTQWFNPVADGAFTVNSKTTTTCPTDARSAEGANYYNFKASNSNSIYGASSHVTPINQAVNYFIKVKEEE